MGVLTQKFVDKFIKERKKEHKRFVNSWSKKDRKKRKAFIKKHGFDYQDTWNLDASIAEFILPRIIYLRDNHCGTPYIYHQPYLTPEEYASCATTDESSQKAAEDYNRDLDKIANGLYRYLTAGFIATDDEVVSEALHLLAEHFCQLWD